MIYIFSQDVAFSRQFGGLVAEIESFNEETRLASRLKAKKPDAVFFDLRSGVRPVKLIERIFMEEPSIVVFVVLPAIGLEDEIFCDREFYWPVEIEKIVVALNEIKEGRELLRKTGIAGRSGDLIKAARTVSKIASSDINVLITGPSGVGKEVIARAIYRGSKITDIPFIAVNVAAMAPGIIESELFGHEKGAFTGASSKRIGVFEQASGGIIFLDEIGEIPLEIQAKLLRVLEERSFSRVGGNAKVRADFRLLAATNRNLMDEVAAGRFREDLYYRLSVVTIDIPALSERKADISPLAYYFLDARKKELKSDNLKIESGAMNMFHRYEWPGNVRELRNVIYSFSVTGPSGRVRAEDFEKYVQDKRPRSKLLPVLTGRTPEAAEHQIIMQALFALTNEVKELRFLIESELDRTKNVNAYNGIHVHSVSGTSTIEEAERELIIRALEESGGNRKKAANALGMGERTLYRKLDKYGLK